MVVESWRIVRGYVRDSCFGGRTPGGIIIKQIPASIIILTAPSTALLACPRPLFTTYSH